jgi:hypothetical protein
MTAVSTQVTVRRPDASGLQLPVTARLYYTNYDPYAVQVTFFVGVAEPATWVLARDVLIDGMNGRAGGGAVTLWPSPGGQAVTIELATPDGPVRFEAPADDIAGFLARACQLVPRGAEYAAADIDAELDSLLAGGTQS